MPTAVPAIYMSAAQRRRDSRDGIGAMIGFAVLPIVVALLATAVTHHGSISRDTIKATLLQAGDAIASAEMPH